MDRKRSRNHDAGPALDGAHLAERQCRSLVAEQARELAHKLRSPLGAIELVCESLLLERPDGDCAERLQVALRASAKLKQVLEESVSEYALRWRGDASLDFSALCSRFAQVNGLECECLDPEPMWVSATAQDGELALWHALALARPGCRHGRVRMTLVETAQGAELALVPADASVAPDQSGLQEGPGPEAVSDDALVGLRRKWLKRFAAERGGVVELDPPRLVMRLPVLSAAPSTRSQGPDGASHHPMYFQNQQEATMTDRHTIIAQFKTKLDQWDAEIDELEAKARGASAEARSQLHEQIAQIKEQRSDARSRLDELRESSQDAWHDVQAGAQRATDALGESLKAAWSRF